MKKCIKIYVILFKNKKHLFVLALTKQGQSFPTLSTIFLDPTKLK